MNGRHSATPYPSPSARLITGHKREFVSLIRRLLVVVDPSKDVENDGALIGLQRLTFTARYDDEFCAYGQWPTLTATACTDGDVFHVLRGRLIRPNTRPRVGCLRNQIWQLRYGFRLFFSIHEEIFPAFWTLCILCEFPGLIFLDQSFL